jgi:hypothetical protein
VAGLECGRDIEVPYFPLSVSKGSEMAPRPAEGRNFLDRLEAARESLDRFAARLARHGKGSAGARAFGHFQTGTFPVDSEHSSASALGFPALRLGAWSGPQGWRCSTVPALAQSRAGEHRAPTSGHRSAPTERLS